MTDCLLPTPTDCLHILLSFVNNKCYCQKLTSNHLSVSSAPSLSTLQFSLVSIYLVHQPIYLTVFFVFFYYNLFRLFPSDFFFFLFFLSFFSFLFSSRFFLRFLVVFVAVAVAAVVFVTSHLLFSVS